jgi:hypothetical protein
VSGTFANQQRFPAIGAVAVLGLAALNAFGQSTAPAPPSGSPAAPGASATVPADAPSRADEQAPTSNQTALPPTAGAPTEPAPPGAGACYPECREGFVCTEGRCVSVCNPPCPADQICVDGRYCEVGPPRPGGVVEPPPPRRIPFEERSFSMIGVHYRFPTDVMQNGAEGPHGPALGVNLRSDVPVAGYLLVGPMFEFASYEPGYYFDLDFYIRARVPIDAKAVQFQLWAGMPIGLTFSFLSDDYALAFEPDLDGFSLGWNIGFLFGGAVHFSRNFGIYSELGWQQHKMSHDRLGGGEVDLEFKPWVWNVGFVLRN